MRDDHKERTINVINGHFHGNVQRASIVRTNFNHEIQQFIDVGQTVDYYVAYTCDMCGQFLRNQLKSLIDLSITGN